MLVEGFMIYVECTGNSLQFNNYFVELQYRFNDVSTIMGVERRDEVLQKLGKHDVCANQIPS